MPKTSIKRTIWLNPADDHTIQVVDQRRLPHEVIIVDLTSLDAVVWAIKEMVVRGAPLIAATAGYGIYFACLEALETNDPATYLEQAFEKLRHSRPTAVNLFWTIDRM